MPKLMPLRGYFKKVFVIARDQRYQSAALIILQEINRVRLYRLRRESILS
ncbi:hypothetical protein SAMN05216409_108212 [Pseudomonas lutea]|uniref:Uncharacterized protein n=1 Tax=Pseudomonas lutea TaxID=243924 RepID=A0A9X8QK57_9PSED|nr:hypothetical protein SAMN05216409_108212 [Pseudomonas lutea]